MEYCCIYTFWAIYVYAHLFIFISKCHIYLFPIKLRLQLFRLLVTADWK